MSARDDIGPHRSEHAQQFLLFLISDVELIERCDKVLDQCVEGGIVNSSRGILFPDAAKGTTDTKIWEQAFDAALDQATHELGAAIQN